MRIYIFKSETRSELHAFAGDPDGSKLPSMVLGLSLEPLDQRKILPTTSHVIEAAIDSQGFQLWRLGKKSPARRANRR